MTLEFDVVKRNFRRFCENTSCHGFCELIEAKTLFWRTFWILICFSAFAVTAYQVVKTILQYLYSSTSTVITTAQDNEIMYPPLQLCYWHWLYWVDFWKVSQLKIDKEALLFSFNFYTRIYSTISYDVDVAEQKLTKYLIENNFSSVFTFHQSIARSVPIYSDTNFTAYFDKTEVVFEDPGFTFCYTVSSDRLFQYFNDNLQLVDVIEKNKIIRFSVVNENYEDHSNNMSTFVTVTEYNRYMLRWINHKTQYRIHDASVQNLTVFAPPILMFPNAFNGESNIPIIPDRSEYIINMKSFACRWLNRPGMLCLGSYRSISPNETCHFACESRVYTQNCSCIRFDYAIYLKKDTPHEICRDKFYLVSDTGNEYLAYSSTPNQMIYNQGCLKTFQTVADFKRCQELCPETCELWYYDVSALLTIMPSFLIKIATKNQTNITLTYPLKNEILIMVESNKQSWGSFVGDVGGLLGIWTGASVLSFIQMIYLCCCIDVEKLVNLKKHTQKEAKSALPVQATIIVEAKCTPKLLFPVNRSAETNTNFYT